MEKKKMTFDYEDLNNLSYALQLACVDCIGGDNGILPDDYHIEMGRKLNELLNKIQRELGLSEFTFKPMVDEEEE